jgi:hypothetical protein
MTEYDPDTDPEWPRARRSHLVVPDLVDVHFAEESYRWFLLCECGAHDMSLDEASEEVVGEPCATLAFEAEQVGWEGMFDFGWRHELHAGHEFTCSKMRWALQAGVAPGQAFLVRFGTPRYSTSYDGEGDVEYDVEFVRALAVEPHNAYRRWLRYLIYLSAARDAHITVMNEMRQAEEHDIVHMEIHGQLFFNSKQRFPSEMEFPAGVRFTLRSVLFHRFTQLAVGESEDGSHEAAMAALWEHVQDNYPHIQGAQLRGMRRRW